MWPGAYSFNEALERYSVCECNATTSRTETDYLQLGAEPGQLPQAGCRECAMADVQRPQMGRAIQGAEDTDLADCTAAGQVKGGPLLIHQHCEGAIVYQTLCAVNIWMNPDLNTLHES